MTHGKPRRPQRERVEESMNSLLDAAIDLLVEQGIVRTTAQQIATRAGYSREMVRVRYGTKEALIEAILTGPVEDLLTSPTPGATSGLEALVLRIAMLENLVVDEPRLLKAFLVVGFEAAGGADSVRPHMVSWLNRISSDLTESATRGQVDSSIRSDADPSRVARWIVRAVIGLSYDWLIAPDTDMAQGFRDLTDQVRRDLLP